MNEKTHKLLGQAVAQFFASNGNLSPSLQLGFNVPSEVFENFAQLIIEETLKEVDERVYSRGENQWYYDVDKKWIRLYFGYGELFDKVVKK